MMSNQGPDSQLDDKDREQLVELLEDGAQAHGWETDLWVSKCIAALIENEFGIDYVKNRRKASSFRAGIRAVHVHSAPPTLIPPRVGY